MKISFEKSAWEDYLYWQKSDKEVFKKLNALLKEILRTPFEGRGKPEPLKHVLGGFWSRRLTLEHRIVYKFENETLTVIQCRYHY